MLIRLKCCISFLLALLCLFFSTTDRILASDVDGLAFFRATKDNSGYKKSPTRYERILITDRAAKHEYYVERHPAHVVSTYAIQAVVVGKTKKYGNSPEELREFAKEVSGENAKSDESRIDYPKGFTYNLTFRLAEQESKRFIKFNDANLNKSFEVRIGGRSRGVVEPAYPYEPDESKHAEFTIITDEDDASKIKELLSPFEGKVIWQ
jgi:hypothetical protein